MDRDPLVYVLLALAFALIALEGIVIWLLVLPALF